LSYQEMKHIANKSEAVYQTTVSFLIVNTFGPFTSKNITHATKEA
jgi:hypothetical protein